MSEFREMVEEYIHSSTHLTKRHIHPRLLKLFEAGGMSAVFTRAEGQYLYDADGNRYLDFLGGGGVMLLGRNHPRVNMTLRTILDMELPNLCVVNASILGGVLAEKLLNLAGPHFTKVLYANSGTEASEICIRFSRYCTKRRRYLYMKGSFHGRTYGAISLCGWEQLKEDQAPMMPICTPLEPNNIQQLRRELSKGDVAAVFYEPIQGMTCTELDPGYLREMEILCERYGTIMVADEVQTGLGRTGSWFRSTENGIRPGMMTVSKILSGGQAPVSAVLMSEEVYERVYSKFTSGPIYFSTFAQNNLAMAAGIATIEALEEMDAPHRVRELGDMLRSGLEELKERYDVIDEIRGDGLMIAIYFKESQDLGLKVQQKVMAAADSGSFGAAVNVDLYTKHRIIVQIPGPGTNAIKILPPAIISDEDVKYFLSALEDVLANFYERTSGPIVSISRGFVKSAAKQIRDKVPKGLLPAALAGSEETGEAPADTGKKKSRVNGNGAASS